MAGVAVNRATDLRAREDVVADYEARIQELEADLRFVKNRADDPIKKAADQKDKDRLVGDNEHLKFEIARLEKKNEEEIFSRGK